MASNGLFYVHFIILFSCFIIHIISRIFSTDKCTVLFCLPAAEKQYIFQIYLCLPRQYKTVYLNTQLVLHNYLAPIYSPTDTNISKTFSRSQTSTWHSPRKKTSFRLRRPCHMRPRFHSSRRSQEIPIDALRRTLYAVVSRCDQMFIVNLIKSVF